MFSLISDLVLDGFLFYQLKSREKAEPYLLVPMDTEHVINYMQFYMKLYGVAMRL